MVESKEHTHRLVMQRPGVFHCVYCGRLFGSPSQATESLASHPAGPPRWSLARTRAAVR